jgi:hypothetical protein
LRVVVFGEVYAEVDWCKSFVKNFFVEELHQGLKTFVQVGELPFLGCKLAKRLSSGWGLYFRSDVWWNVNHFICYIIGPIRFQVAANEVLRYKLGHVLRQILSSFLPRARTLFLQKIKAS